MTAPEVLVFLAVLWTAALALAARADIADWWHTHLSFADWWRLQAAHLRYRRALAARRRQHLANFPRQNRRPQ
jgi:hypothetical protein